jgi:cell division protein FtsI/penicillin-binding protein 2
MQEGRNLKTAKPVRRVRLLFTLVAIAIGVFWVRAFYLEIIQYDHFRAAAQSDQKKEYIIPAARGVIEAHNGEGLVPIVLNQKLFTIYVDPQIVKKPEQAASTLASVLGGNESDYRKKIDTTNTRYVIIAKQVPEDKKKEILKPKYSGIGAQEMSYRTYPNGTLAAQLLGFVNDEGKGVYGIEQALNGKLSGTPGRLKAVTDINGVPLAANKGNIQIAPKSGQGVVLTIDVAMQKQLESILQKGLKDAKSESGSALIMEANTGAVKAMANWPTYDPAKFASVEDANVFNNNAVSSPLEVGSIMKPLTAAAALDQGVVKADTSYDDPASWKVDGYRITNIEEDGGAGRRSVADILNLSLNTGATWLLMQMGKPGSTEINEKGRNIWYRYMADHYRFGKLTGIEQGYESEGIVPDPNRGDARDLTYANTSFGQAMTATPIQMAAACAAIVNGGTYYQPTLVDQIINADGTRADVAPKVVRTNVVSPKVSKDMQNLLEYVVEKHYMRPAFNQSLYSVGGKTGTAQIADRHGAGGYKEHDFNGTYLGFVGGDNVQYIISVRVNEPKNGGYAGTAAAQPIFATLGHMLIDNFGVTPKGH